MIKKRCRHAAAYKLRIAVEVLEGSKTIVHCLTDRAPSDQRFVP